MKTIQVIKILGKNDLKNIMRDDYISYLIFMPLGLGLLLRWGLPAVLDALGTYFASDLSSYYAVIAVCSVLLLLPIISGAIAGFLHLDQKDNKITSVLLLTPVSPRQYMLYNLLLPFFGSLLGTWLALLLANPADLGLLRLFVLSLSASPLAPLLAFAVACFAENKIQGFAMMKGTIALWIAPISAFYISPPWQYLLGIIPLYWPCRLYQVIAEGKPILPTFLAGWLYSGILLYLLLKLFDRKVYQAD
ncbi:hypothetical protein [Candidatus Contubernalis alkaliaceticus]|uniref:hypothetical protein n=1 Tax=Candidatus Contubernalis alkaliaceticus TaxID=338645 RepID=UPI001F4C19AB|nr:hypothetical protein [Candidatus Contubernalis alkalaceticus]UNC93016.1 hypothetical protein HUE98_13490 [Candidatus Contubernalis alkalaceticus]